MNAKISVFVICVEEIIYLLSYNFHDCTFKKQSSETKLSIMTSFFESITRNFFDLQIIPS